MSQPPLFQPGILDDVPAHGRYLTFRVAPGVPRATLAATVRVLGDAVDGRRAVLGVGPSLARALTADVRGLHALAPRVGAGVDVPSTPAALWLWLRGDNPGELLHAGRRLEALAAPAFAVVHRELAFRFTDGRDLSGYIDGTENPTGDAALRAAFATDLGPGLDGGSLVAVQRWRHDLGAFQALPGEGRDHTIGRRHSDNEELEDAPSSAHVKRTAQESFEPEAFVLRRSMPWANPEGEGLVFTAFGATLDAFEALLDQMVGANDGVVDALFRFTRPETGGTFWCPPVDPVTGHLDLRALSL